MAHLPFYKPEQDSPEIKYLLKRREELGGYLPERGQLRDKLGD